MGSIKSRGGSVGLQCLGFGPGGHGELRSRTLTLRAIKGGNESFIKVYQGGLMGGLKKSGRN